MHKLKLSYVQLKALRATAEIGGCLADNYKTRTWARLHELEFISPYVNRAGFATKIIKPAGRQYLEDLAKQPITEAIDFPPDGRDFGGGADF
jgi:hypothetical protein